MNLKSKISYNENVLTSDLDGELVMLNMESSYYYGLENIGKFIWDKMSTPVSSEMLIKQLMAHFDVDKETCTKEVMLFIEELQKEGLIVVHG